MESTLECNEQPAPGASSLLAQDAGHAVTTTCDSGTAQQDGNQGGETEETRGEPASAPEPQAEAASGAACASSPMQEVAAGALHQEQPPPDSQAEAGRLGPDGLSDQADVVVAPECQQPGRPGGMHGLTFVTLEAAGTEATAGPDGAADAAAASCSPQHAQEGPAADCGPPAPEQQATEAAAPADALAGEESRASLASGRRQRSRVGDSPPPPAGAGAAAPDAQPVAAGSGPEAGQTQQVLAPGDLAGLAPIRTSVNAPVNTLAPHQAPNPAAPHQPQACDDGSRAAAEGEEPAGAEPGVAESEAPEPGDADAAGSGYDTGGVIMPLYRRRPPARVLSVRVRRTGPLAAGTRLTDPVVRLHVVSAATGEYLRLAGGGGDDGRMRHVVDSGVQAEILDFPGRPALTTVDNNSGLPKSALLEYLPPVQTRPFDISDTAAAYQPTWEEELLVDMSPAALVEADALLLLEVLQLPSSFHRYNRHADDYSRATSGGHEVAWAFLRLGAVEVPAAGAASSGGLAASKGAAATGAAGSGGHELALQLYRYQSPGAALAAAFGGAGQQPLPQGLVRDAYAAWRETLGAEAAAAFATPATQGTSPLAKAILAARHEAAKYPGALHVAVSAVPRPEPEVVVTLPAEGVRPCLPAGYGSGFETGRSALHLPRGGQAANGSAGGVPGSPGSPGMAGRYEPSRLEQLLFRPHTSACQPPNAHVARIAGTPGGCSAIALSNTGAWLAAALGDVDGRYKVCLFQPLTGRQEAVLGVHDALVYSLTWSRDDGALVSASADFTARVWHMVPGGAPGAGLASSAGHGHGVGGRSRSRNSWSAAPSSPFMPGFHGAVSVDLQHTCYVYVSAFHPMCGRAAAAATGGMPVVATGAYDGRVRLFNSVTGRLLHCLEAGGSPVNALAFDQMGGRLYVGEGSGLVTEYAVDLACEVVLRKLRSTQELARQPISQLLVHPGGHHLLAMTRTSSLVGLDLKMLAVAKRFEGPKCSTHPLKAAISPDGEWVVCGSEDGSAHCWDWATTAQTPVPHLSPGPGPLTAVAWSYSFQVVAACRFSPYAPVKVLGYDPSQPALAVSEAAAERRPVNAAKTKAQQRRHRHDYELPQRLTPQHVRALLADVRSEARHRGVFQAPHDPEGNHLVVRSSPGAPPVRLGTTRLPAAAAADGSDGGGAAAETRRPRGGVPLNRRPPVGALTAGGSAGGGTAGMASRSTAGGLGSKAGATDGGEQQQATLTKGVAPWLAATCSRGQLLPL